MIRVLYYFAYKELVQTLREPRMRFFLFVVPVIQLVLFGYALSSEVRNIRFAVVAPPGDRLASDIYRQAIGSGWLIPAQSGPADPYERIRDDRADAILIAPVGGIERAIARGDGPPQLLVDATNVTRARAVEQYVLAAAAESMKSRLAAQPQPPAPAPSLEMAVRVLFNPSLDTATFMVPGIMAQILTMVSVILTANSIAREKERGTFEALIAAPVQTWELILGKSIPYFLIGLAQVPLVLGAAVAIFHIPIRGSLLVIALAAITYLCATVSVGILVATFCRTEQQATMASLLTLMPAILLSGIMFPVHTMPLALQAFAYVNPVTYFAELLRNVLLKGGNTRVVVIDMAVLLCIAAVMTTVSVRRFRATL